MPLMQPIMKQVVHSSIQSEYISLDNFVISKKLRKAKVGAIYPKGATHLLHVIYSFRKRG
jgi:hypothetical protein